MEKTIEKWFFMRAGFDTFRLEPDKHRQYMFGHRDRQLRDVLLGSIEESCFSREGHKATVYGDYGRGKTHQCHNIIYEIGKRNLPLVPVYIKCPAWKTKEPFQSLFKEMITRHRSEDLRRVATEYEKRVQAGTVQKLHDIIDFEDIAEVMSKALTAINIDEVKKAMRWLGGEPKIEMATAFPALQPQLTDSREFGAVLRALAHMYLTVDAKVLLYLVDEAERFQNITNTDSYFSWLASLRELTEILGVALVFQIGAKTRNDLPTIFVQEEIVRRIGLSNYLELNNPGQTELRDFIDELLKTTIRKGEVPDVHKRVMSPEAFDPTIPQELYDLVDNDQDKLGAYPFEPDALNTFVTELSAGGYANKPSEVLVRLQKYALRAMRYDSKLITEKIVQEVNAEGF
jgi:Cdc6-like AAA superfamily ATPase